MTQAGSIDAQLTEACKRGDLASAQELVEKGAIIDQPEIDGPLFMAAYHGHHTVVKWLLEAGAEVDIRNSKNSTPLMAAAEQGKTECVKALMKAGASTSTKNNHSISARGYAVRNNHKSVLDYIDRNPDEVVFSWRVNDRTLQEIFNFAQRERVTLIRNGAEGPVEAVTRQSFSEITDRATLRKAFEKYKAEGGARSEEEVFSSNIIPKKPRLGS